MPETDLILGEFRRALDERFRISIPSELATPLTTEGADGVLAKELPGCVSLWNAKLWQRNWARDDERIREQIAGRVKDAKLSNRIDEIQRMGRFLSTRHTDVKIAGRGRLLIPEGFREFLGVDRGEELLVVGAAVCVELWHPAAWRDYLKESIQDFRTLFAQLAE